MEFFSADAGEISQTQSQYLCELGLSQEVSHDISISSFSFCLETKRNKKFKALSCFPARKTIPQAYAADASSSHQAAQSCPNKAPFLPAFSANFKFITRLNSKR